MRRCTFSIWTAVRENNVKSAKPVQFTLIQFGVCVQFDQQLFRDHFNPLPDMTESWFAYSIRVNAAEGVQKLIVAAGKASQSAGGSVYVSESLILDGGGDLAWWRWIDPYRPAQFFLHSGWHPGPAIRLHQRTDESWLLHEEPWLFLKTEICSKRVPVQLAELLQTALPVSVWHRWFFRVETERGHICDFLSPSLRAGEASYFSA